MVDNNFRSYRSRDPVAPEDVHPTARKGSGDPLAELARLIGQSDPYAETDRHEAHSPSDVDAAASGLDWGTDESYAEPQNRADDRYVAPPPAKAYPSYAPQERSYEQDRGYEQEPPASDRFFSGPAAKFNGFREDTPEYPAAHEAPSAHDAHSRDVQVAVPPTRQSPAHTSAPANERYAANQQAADAGEAYADDDYYDDGPTTRRRGGLVVVMAVLGLAVLGTAGAFAYRTMFGGSVLPTLPPIIKAGNGPNKIMPSYGDAGASNSNQAGVASAGSAEKLVSREEQPVDIQEPPKTAPRVISTIPISPGPSSVPSGASVPVAPTPGVPAPVAPSLAAASPAVASPTPMAVPLPPAAPPPALVSSEPKKIHTVTIRSDQLGGTDAAPAAPATPSPAPRSITRAKTPKPKPSTATAAAPAAPAENQPLSLAPDAQGEPSAPPPTRTRTTLARASVAAPVSGTAAEASSGGGYAVQVSSQRSEADAHAAFRTLRAKFPNQLGGREPIVRRADLGARGIYYRALVGPFASMEEAAGMCSSLKAAGGNCLVQRN